MKKIGIISDTHGLFDDTLRRFLDDVDEVWHAGDFGNIETADAIAAFKPLVGVYGNIDGGATRLAFPETKLWNCEQVKVLMTHIGGYPGRYERSVYHQIMKERPQLFISGHSHILKVQFDRQRNMLHINPGAAGVNGFHKVRTAARMVVDGGDMRELEIGEWPRSS